MPPIHSISIHQNPAVFGTKKQNKENWVIKDLPLKIDLHISNKREHFKQKQSIKHQFFAMPALTDKQVASNRFDPKNWKEWKQVRNIMKEGLKSFDSTGEKIWYCASPVVQWGLDALMLGIPTIFRIFTRDTDFINISPALRDFNQAMHIVHANRISNHTKTQCDDLDKAFEEALKTSETLNELKEPSSKENDNTKE